MFSLRAPATTLLLAFSLSACDTKSLIITPENLSIEQLKQELNLELDQGAEPNEDNESQPPLTISRKDGGLLLKGDPALIAKAIIIAKRLDVPSSYYLQIRNTRANTISTSAETMQILLHPGQAISLGHITLIDSPWSSLIKQHESSLQLHLDNDLMLTIDIINQQQKSASYYTGKHPMQLQKWMMAFNDSEMNQRKTTITTKPKKQLWLRLIKASSQSGVELR
jgi:hypothetical protein